MKNRYEKSLLAREGFSNRVISKSNICCLGKVILADILSNGNYQNSPNNKPLMYNKGGLYQSLIQARGNHDR